MPHINHVAPLRTKDVSTSGNVGLQYFYGSFDVWGELDQLALIFREVYAHFRISLIEHGLPAAPNQDQRPPAEGIHNHQVPHQRNFGQRAGAAGQGDGGVAAGDKSVQPLL